MPARRPSIAAALCLLFCASCDQDPDPNIPIDRRFVSSSTLAISQRGLFWIDGNELKHRDLAGGTPESIASTIPGAYARLALNSSQVVWPDSRGLMALALNAEFNKEERILSDARTGIGVALTESHAYFADVGSSATVIELDIASGQEEHRYTGLGPALDLRVVNGDIFGASCGSFWRIPEGSEEAEPRAGGGCFLEIGIAESATYLLDVGDDGIRRLPNGSSDLERVDGYSAFVPLGDGILFAHRSMIVERSGDGTLLRAIAAATNTVVGMAHDGDRVYWLERSAEAITLMDAAI